MPAKKSGSDGPVELVRIPTETVRIPIRGVTPLITHAWSAKAKRMMLTKQMTPGTRAKKEAKDPQADYESSMYRLEDGGYGFPATGFKAAIVGACRLFDGLTMVVAKQTIFVAGVGTDMLVPLDAKPEMREDMVRLESGVADIRYRAQFWPWAATLHVKYLPSMLTLKGLIALVEASGHGGVGEWRPSAPKVASGSYGMYEIDVDAFGEEDM